MVEVASIEVTPAPVTVTAGETVQLEARARDASGSLLSGRSVSWSSDNAGVATVTSSGVVQAVAAGQTIIRAASEGVQGVAEVTVVPGPRIELGAVAFDFVLARGDAEPATGQATITNAGGGQLSNLSVSTTYGHGGSGWLSASLVGSTAPATLEVEARAAGLEPGGYTARVAVTSPVATNSPVHVDVDLEILPANPVPVLVSVEPGSARWDETLEVRLEGGNFEAGVTEIDFGPRIAVNAVQVQSDTTLLAEITVDPTADLGTRDVAVHNPPPGGGTAVAAAAFAVIGDVSSSQSSVSVSPIAGLVADGTEAATITLTIRDAADSPITGLGSDAFSVTVTGSATASPVTETHMLGTYAFSVTNTVVETVQVDVEVEGVALDESITIQFIAGSVSATHSTVSAWPFTGVTADGSATSTITIHLRDAHGNAIPGLEPARFDIAGSGSGTVAFGSVTETDAPGTYALTVANTTAETVVVSVTADEVALNDEPAVQFVPGPVHAGQSAISASPAAGVTADGVAESIVTVVLRDANANAIGGQASAAFDVTATGAAVAGDVVESATPGTYAFAVTNEVAESVQVSVSAAGVALQPTLEIGFVPGPVATIELTAATADLPSGSVRVLTATLRDGTGNVVSSGAQSALVVAFNQTTGPGSVSGLGSAAAVEGVATRPVTGVGPGHVSLVASTEAPDVTSNVVSFAVVSGEASQLTIETQPSSSAVSGVAFAQQPAVQLRDGAGNPVAEAGVSVTAAVASGAAALSGTTAAVTDGSGLAMFTDLTLTGAAGPHTLSFGGSGLGSVASGPIELAAGGSDDALVAMLAGKRVLWAGAHPDDEVAVAALLGEACLFHDAECNLMVATHGEKRCLIPGPCAEIRGQEMREVAELFGAELYHWTLADGPASTPEAVLEEWSESMESPEQLRDSVHDLLDTIEPEVIITFDPRHGATCHPDHRAVSMLVLDVLADRPEPRPDVLFVAVVLSGGWQDWHTMEADPGAVEYDATRSIPGSDLTTWSFVVESIGIYRSQFTPEQAEFVADAPAELRKHYLGAHQLGSDVSGGPC